MVHCFLLINPFFCCPEKTREIGQKWKNKMTSSSPAKPILATNFIPLEPEEISAQWLFEVINQYRNLKELSLVSDADDLKQCEISEKKSSKGRFSSTYTIDVKFKVSMI